MEQIVFKSEEKNKMKMIEEDSVKEKQISILIESISEEKEDVIELFENICFNYLIKSQIFRILTVEHYYNPSFFKTQPAIKKFLEENLTQFTGKFLENSFLPALILNFEEKSEKLKINQKSLISYGNNRFFGSHYVFDVNLAKRKLLDSEEIQLFTSSRYNQQRNLQTNSEIHAIEFINLLIRVNINYSLSDVQNHLFNSLKSFTRIVFTSEFINTENLNVQDFIDLIDLISTSIANEKRYRQTIQSRLEYLCELLMHLIHLQPVLSPAHQKNFPASKIISLISEAIEYFIMNSNFTHYLIYNLLSVLLHLFTRFSYVFFLALSSFLPFFFPPPPSLLPLPPSFSLSSPSSSSLFTSFLLLHHILFRPSLRLFPILTTPLPPLPIPPLLPPKLNIHSRLLF